MRLGSPPLRRSFLESRGGIKTNGRDFLILLEMTVKSFRSFFWGYLFFSLFFPLGFLLVFGETANPSIVPYIISGTVTTSILLNSITGVSQTIGSDRQAGRLSLLISLGIPLWQYAVVIAITNGASAIVSSAVVILIAQSVFRLHTTTLSIIPLILNIGAGLFSGSMLGLLISVFIHNLRIVNQLSSILGIGLSFFAAVYFPIDYLPSVMRWFAVLEPSTLVSQGIASSLEGGPDSFVWALGSIVEGIVFLILTRFRSIS